MDNASNAFGKHFFVHVRLFTYLSQFRNLLWFIFRKMVYFKYFFFLILPWSFLHEKPQIYLSPLILTIRLIASCLCRLFLLSRFVYNEARMSSVILLYICRLVHVPSLSLSLSLGNVRQPAWLHCTVFIVTATEYKKWILLLSGSVEFLWNCDLCAPYFPLPRSLTMETGHPLAH